VENHEIIFETQEEKDSVIYAIKGEIEWMREYWPKDDELAKAAIADSEQHLQKVLAIKPRH